MEETETFELVNYPLSVGYKIRSSGPVPTTVLSGHIEILLRDSKFTGRNRYAKASGMIFYVAMLIQDFFRAMKMIWYPRLQVKGIKS